MVFNIVTHFQPTCRENTGHHLRRRHRVPARVGSPYCAHITRPRETNFLFQRVSVHIQRYNVVAFRGSFEESETES